MVTVAATATRITKVIGRDIARANYVSVKLLPVVHIPFFSLVPLGQLVTHYALSLIKYEFLH